LRRSFRLGIACILGLILGLILGRIVGRVLGRIPGLADLGRRKINGGRARLARPGSGGDPISSGLSSTIAAVP
jgi:hypothetical protein